MDAFGPDNARIVHCRNRSALCSACNYPRFCTWFILPPYILDTLLTPVDISIYALVQIAYQFAFKFQSEHGSPIVGTNISRQYIVLHGFARSKWCPRSYTDGVRGTRGASERGTTWIELKPSEHTHTHTHKTRAINDSIFVLNIQLNFIIRSWRSDRVSWMFG